MNYTQHLLIGILLCVITSASFADTKGGLFVNLTKGDTWAAAKAITFAHKKALKWAILNWFRASCLTLQ